MIRTLGIASELLALKGVSVITDHGGYVMQETPNEPDYWVGNQLILRSPEIEMTHAVQQFARHFPKAHHVALVWDMPDLGPTRIDPTFASDGWEVEVFDVLTLTGQMAEATLPGGIVFRPLSGSADWEKALLLQLEIGIEEGFPAGPHEDYLRRRNVNRRGQIAKGFGQWFGAFEGDQIVAQMGMFHDGNIARYQSVETRATHRRRGICAALLRHCCLWAQRRAPGAVPVIIASADSDAGRLYQRMGFAQSEQLVGVLKPGYAH